MRGFRSFVLRGNVVDLAVAVLIGAAFGAVVTAFTKDLLTPLLAAVGGQPDFSRLGFTLNGSRFRYGDFLNALITLLTVATAMFFLVVTPINRLFARRAEEDPETKACPECTSSIPVKARRCPLCTSPMPAA